MIKILGLVAILSFTACEKGRDTPCALKFPSPVKTVGGCNNSGMCIAVLEDGTRVIAYMPIAGEMLCGTFCAKR